MAQSANNKKKAIQNLVVYGENNQDLSPNYVHCQRMEVVGKKNNYHIKPHLHSNLFQIHLVEKGSIKYKLDGEASSQQGPLMVIIPENILHELAYDETLIGKSISISYALLEQLMDYYPKGILLLKKVMVLPMENQASFFRDSVNITAQLEKELNGNLLGKEQQIRNILGQLLVAVLRISTFGKKQYGASFEDLSYKHFNAFQNAIKEHCNAQRQLKEYAENLQITPVHLNRICNTVVGKTAKHVVIDYLILEARRHLQYSSHSISEICFMLNFKSQSYFSRCFKNATGISPKKYRESL